MRKDEAARLLGVPSKNDVVQMLEDAAGNESDAYTPDEFDPLVQINERSRWARDFERMMNAQDEPEHEPSATPVQLEFKPAGPGDLNHSFQN